MGSSELSKPQMFGTAQSPRALLVDDDPLIRQLLDSFLNRAGVTVLQAADGEQAWEVLDREPVDVVITDVNMPRRSGIELLESLREERPSVPVIIITGAPSVDAAVECMKTGAFDYISKPFELKHLLRTVVAAVKHGIAIPDQPVPGGRQVLGGYRVVRPLGEGNTGVVLLVERQGDASGTQYAMKVLKLGGVRAAVRENLMKRFLNEAGAASQVAHPHVIRFIEYGIAPDEQIPYLVMEYFPYPSLGDLMPKLADQPCAHKLMLLRQTASALAAIHAAGICHRDVKPGNILVDMDSVTAKIGDFGIAKLPESDLTESSSLIGSPAYMAPEAFVSADVDPRADLFSLGVVAYELLLGTRPFQSETVAQLAREIPNLRPTAPRKLVPDFSPALQAVLARLLRKKPEHRYQTAEQLVEDLDAIAASAMSASAANLWRRVTDSLFTDWS